MEFMKKAMDWVLDKEDALANQCAIKPEDVTREILSLEKKKDKLQKTYEENMKEIEHVLQRLAVIKAHASSCKK